MFQFTFRGCKFLPIMGRYRKQRGILFACVISPEWKGEMVCTARDGADRPAGHAT